jgi:hypothetical protein
VRILAMAWVTIGLLVGPSFGVINVKLTADKTTLLPGETTLVRIWAEGTTAGLWMLAGSIAPTVGDPLVLDATGPFVWAPEFHGPLGIAKYGIPGGYGAWLHFGSMRSSVPGPDLDYVNVAWYTVTALGLYDFGTVALNFSGEQVTSFAPREIDKSGVLGMLTPVSITVVPEPVTLAMLGLAGLLIARRRRA